ncbi:MAG: hypothetical protein H6565_01565 [Lewinellaceae bacterium]|nr:hypothetical protein [Lewinellaceae bacterium]
MKRNWQDIKWIFEPDGALRDIYVQEVSLNDWKKIIDLINKGYKVNYSGTNQINKSYVVEYLTDETGEIESKSASIFLGEIRLNCHFFLEDQIEFDVDPKEVNSLEDFELIENFMVDVSKSIDNQITLTDENNPKFPLVKIDSNRGINKILTEEEVKEYWGNPGSFMNKMKLFKTKLEMKFMPGRFKEKLLSSANESYKSTKKSENVW